MFSYSTVTKSLGPVVVRLVLGHMGQPGDPRINSWPLHGHESGPNQKIIINVF